MVVYCCAKHGSIIAKNPATTTTSHDNCGAQGNNTRNTPQFIMQQHSKWKRLHQKCADRYMDFHYTHKLVLNGTQKVMQNI